MACLGGHAVHAIRLLEGALFAQSEVGADLAIFFLYTRVVCFGKRESCRFAFLDGGASGVNSERGHMWKT